MGWNKNGSSAVSERPFDSTAKMDDMRAHFKSKYLNGPLVAGCSEGNISALSLMLSDRTWVQPKNLLSFFIFLSLKSLISIDYFMFI